MRPMKQKPMKIIKIVDPCDIPSIGLRSNNVDKNEKNNENIIRVIIFLRNKGLVAIIKNIL